MSSLTKYQISTGRRLYNFFNACNSFSFALVTGNILVLYAMYLEANSVIIGLISAFGFLSYFAIPVGRLLAKKVHFMKVYADSWLWRNISLILMIPIPILVFAGIPRAGLFLILISALLFNFFRGIGLVANNPVLSELAPGRDRGSYLVRLSLINNTGGLLAGLLLTLALGVLPSLYVFSGAIIAGIIAGFAASFILYKMPKSKTAAEVSGGNFSKNFSIALADKNFRTFLLAFCLIGFGVGMIRPFIIVYCREVYGQNDSIISLISFFSTFGALAMGLVTRLFIDRVGAKPMYLIFSGMSVLSLLPALIAPSFGFVPLTIVFLCFTGFITNFGFSGEENAAQIYFFGIVPPNAVMDLSIVYFFILGATGAAGSLFGGVILDFFAELKLSPVTSYRMYFFSQIILIAVSIVYQLKLKTMGSYSLRKTLPLFFSIRDIKALGLLCKLDRSGDLGNQQKLLSELKQTSSSVALTDIIELLSSPSFSVRFEALSSLETVPRLDIQSISALILELERGLFTTASKAAFILGKFKIIESRKHLYKALESKDYQLVSESMIALAKMNDERGQIFIGDVLRETENPHILLSGIRAMTMYKNASALTILLDVLSRNIDFDIINHEIMLALSDIMGMSSLFYKPYSRYITDNSLANQLLLDLFDEAAAKNRLKNAVLPVQISDFLEDSAANDAFVENVRSYAQQFKAGILSAMLISSIIDTDLIKLHSFRFFLCFWVISLLINRKLLLR